MKSLFRCLQLKARIAIASLSIVCFCNSLQAKQDIDVSTLGLEELMNIEVTSVSKSAEPLSKAPSAIYVLTQDDIRRSGARSIPEALRMVPGLHVAQIDAGNWAISARGFNNRFSNKLLVLMDGRTLYTPLFSGVYWNVQDTFIEDIERIEVIRGSGGTLWGANAVNGVINITTKRASDTKGSRVVVDLDTNGETLALRHGGSLDNNGHYRFYAKGIDRDAFKTTDDNDAHDSFDMLRAGFRIDLSPSPRDEVTLQGDIYDGDNDQTIRATSLTPPASLTTEDTVENDGSNILLRWTHLLDSASEWTLQAYVDQTHREDNSLEFDIDTYDIDFQHRFPATTTQEITWGLGYRYIEDDIKNTFTVAFTPDNRDQNIISAFIQDKIKLADDLSLTLGTKFENNDYSGSEWQPSARLHWQINEQHNIWTALSRAVRSPSRGQNDLRLNVAARPGTPNPTLISIIGSDDFDAEELTALEVGYRGRLSDSFTLDAAAFYNRYNNLLSREANPFTVEFSPAPTHFLVSTFNANEANANSYGIELSSTWQVTDDWRIHAAYSHLKIDASLNSGSTDTATVSELENTDPEHYVQLRSQYQLAKNLELDTMLYYTGRNREKDIPAYTRVDVRLGWQVNNNLDIDVIGQNLFDDRHPEFTAQDIIANEIPRALGVRLNAKW